MPCARSVARRSARCSWRRRSTSRPSSPSSSPATADGRSLSFPVSRNVHDAGILVGERRAGPGPPARRRRCPRDRATASSAASTSSACSRSSCSSSGAAALVVNELAPRVHNRGHWTIEGARTSQFEQHLRAICGLPLGSVRAVRRRRAMVNLLGDGRGPPGTPRRPGPGPRGSGRARPPLRQATRVRAAQDGPRDGGRRTASTRRWSGRAPHAAATWLGGLRMGEPPPVVGHRRRQPVGLPGPREGVEDCSSELGIPYELRVVSAHRTPDHLFRYAETAARRGIRVIIAGAGGAAHLPGMLAAKTHPAGHRRADPDAAPRRPRLAALDRADAARRSRSRPSPSATPRTRRCSRREILRSQRPGAGRAARRARARRDRADARPIRRHVEARESRSSRADAPVRRPRTLAADGRRTRQPGHARPRPPADGRLEPVLPPSLQGLPPRSVPETRPTPLQPHYILLSVIALFCGAIAITALELGAARQPARQAVRADRRRRSCRHHARRDAPDLALGLGVDAGGSRQGPVPAGVGSSSAVGVPAC